MKTKSNNYWDNRSIERQLISEQKLSRYENQIRSSYRKAMDAIETDMNLIMDNYQRYVGKRFDVQLSRDEARDFLNAVVDPTTMNELRSNWGSRGADIDEILAQTGNYASRITNKQMYRQSVDTLMDEVARHEIEISKMAYTDIIQDSYNRKLFDVGKGTGLDFSMQSIDLKQIQDIMNMNWSGEHFSSRVWRNTSQVAEGLKSMFTIDTLSNRPTQALINELEQYTDYGRYASARLIRTESNAMRTETEAQVSQDLGIEKYRIVATLDMKTSEVCQRMDLKVFFYKDLKIGETAPPFHPNCRTITVDHFDDVAYSSLERIARDPKTGETMYVPADMTYNEWLTGKRNIDIKQSESYNVNEDTKQSKVSKSKKQKQLKIRDDAKTVKLYGIEKEYRIELEEKFNEIYSKYPIDLSKTEFVTNNASGEMGAARIGISGKANRKTMMFEVKYTDRISLSKKTYSDKEKSLFSHRFNGDHRGVKYDYNDMATLWHEYAHQIDYKYALSKNPDVVHMIDNLKTSIPFSDSETLQELRNINKIFAGGPNGSTMSYELDNLMFDRMKEIKGKDYTRDLFYKDVENSFGRYALDNDKEFLAEGFTAINLQEPTEYDRFTKEFANIFNDLFDKELRR